MARIKVEEVPHKCEICHIDLERMPNEPTFNFNKRITCDPSTGRKCRAEMRKIAGMKSHGVIASVMPEPKRCTICGDIIPYGKDTAHRYSSRVICRVKDKPSCFSVFSQNIGKKSAEVKEKKRKAGIPLEVSPKVKARKLSLAQQEAMDKLQREIDRAAFMRNIDQFTTFPAVSLPQEEIKRLEQIYSPPTGPRRDILPHFHRMECTV